MRTLLATLGATRLLAAPAWSSQLEQVATYGGGERAAEVEVAGDLVFLVAGGVDITSIADPAKPERVTKIDCSYASDVALDPTAQILVLALDDGGECLGGTGGIVVYDIRDPARPQVLSEVGMPAGAHTVTMDGRILYANQPDDLGTVRQLEIFDLSDPTRPRPLPIMQFTAQSPHESFARHRPDGRTQLYTANGLGGGQAASVLDVTDPAKATILQTISDPAINYAHQAEVSFDDAVILLSDELLVGSSYGGCGRAAPDAEHGGGLRFYAAAPDGTYAGDGRAARHVEPAGAGLRSRAVHDPQLHAGAGHAAAAGPLVLAGHVPARLRRSANVTELAAVAPAAWDARRSRTMA